VSEAAGASYGNDCPNCGLFIDDLWERAPIDGTEAEMECPWCGHKLAVSADIEYRLELLK
jgi:hypothetical protein